MKAIEYLSYLLIPLLISAIIIYGIWKKTNIYDCFLEGTTEGMKTMVRLFPTILAIMIAITIFRKSGTMDFCIRFLRPIAIWLGIPEEVIPLGIMSSVSGGASLGLLADTLQKYHPDSIIGKTASAILGSSETTLYVLAIYSAAVKTKDTRGVLWIGLACDFIALVVAVWLCV